MVMKVFSSNIIWLRNFLVACQTALNAASQISYEPSTKLNLIQLKLGTLVNEKEMPLHLLYCRTMLFGCLVGWLAGSNIGQVGLLKIVMHQQHQRQINDRNNNNNNNAAFSRLIVATSASLNYFNCPLRTYIATKVLVAGSGRSTGWISRGGSIMIGI